MVRLPEMVARLIFPFRYFDKNAYTSHHIPYSINVERKKFWLLIDIFSYIYIQIKPVIYVYPLLTQKWHAVITIPINRMIFYLSNVGSDISLGTKLSILFNRTHNFRVLAFKKIDLQRGFQNNASVTIVVGVKNYIIMHICIGTYFK